MTTQTSLLKPGLCVLHHGGKSTVTGSCHGLRLNQRGILVDCGLFQGKESHPLNIEFPIGHIDALLLTHSHIDTSGDCLAACQRLSRADLRHGSNLRFGAVNARRCIGAARSAERASFACA